MNDQEIFHSNTRKIKTGCGNLYSTIGVDDDGKIIYCAFILGKTGGCARAWTSSISELLQYIFKLGGEMDIVEQLLRGHLCQNPEFNAAQSCSDGIGMVLRDQHEELLKMLEWMKEDEIQTETKQENKPNE